MLTFLKEKILEKPSRMITYAEFMSLALYDPIRGYYMKENEKVGKRGDFITTSNISDIYGRLLARWFQKLMTEHNLPPAVCEIGGGNGRFASAFIEEWNKFNDVPIQYSIIETSPFHRKLQREQIPFNENIIQLESLEEMSTFRGVIFSNELFDALPVHVIERNDNQLEEVMVSVEGDGLVEKRVPLNNLEIQRYLDENKLFLKENQRIEIPLAMEAMVEKISNVLEVGFVVTVDYGYSDEEWMEPIHREGSLRGYYKHEQKNNVLENPGEMDITSHIHFDALIRTGKKRGIEFISKQRQDEFFLSIGILDFLEEHYDPNPFSEVSRRNRAIRSLIIPSGISTYFNVLVQSKGLR